MATLGALAAGAAALGYLTVYFSPGINAVRRTGGPLTPFAFNTYPIELTAEGIANTRRGSLATESLELLAETIARSLDDVLEEIRLHGGGPATHPITRDVWSGLPLDQVASELRRAWMLVTDEMEHRRASGPGGWTRLQGAAEEIRRRRRD